MPNVFPYRVKSSSEEAGVKTTVIEIDQDYLPSMDKEGVVSYLNSVGFVKGEKENIIIHVIYIAKVVRIVHLDSLYSEMELGFDAPLATDVVIDKVTLGGGRSVNINFKLDWVEYGD